MKSIISNNKECYICKTNRNLEKHHIINGYGLRDKSEKYGLWVYLCREHHTGQYGVHNIQKLDLKLKAKAQQEFERANPTLNWLSIFHKNYKE